MVWEVIAAPEFQTWLSSLPEDGKMAVAVDLEILRQIGPQLGRPHVDTMKGSRHSNMKELRTSSGSFAYRTLFAFDPARRAVVLIGGDKAGQQQRRFYHVLIAKADAIYDRHLERMRLHKPARKGTP